MKLQKLKGKAYTGPDSKSENTMTPAATEPAEPFGLVLSLNQKQALLVETNNEPLRSEEYKPSQGSMSPEVRPLLLILEAEA